MAKKSRRSRRQRAKRPPRPASRARERERARLTERAVPPPPSQPTEAIPTSWREEYQYVYADLKRIGMLSGAMFLVLAILSMVLR